MVLLNVVFFALMVSCQSPKEHSIQLAGEWELCLDSTNVNDIKQLSFDLKINLPGTLDEAGIGKENTVKPVLERETMLHLRRKHEYIGKAWYRKTIVVPEIKTPSKAILILERVLWKSTVYVDGNLAGEAFSLSVPHKYDLTELLTPGEHELLICIDNSRQFILHSHDLAHAYTNHTQVKWNGILGDPAIHFYPVPELTNVQVFPNHTEKKLTIQTEGNLGDNTELQFAVKNSKGSLESEETFLTNPEGIYTLEMPENIKTWDEFSPVLYTLETTLLKEGKKVQVNRVYFGFREIKTKGKNVTINGNPLFLRGTLECCIFPLTGHPPLKDTEWVKIFNSAKAYGLNHIRFHSWCPPKAAFEAADKLGFYLQVEPPNWNTAFGADSASAIFIEDEANRIIKEYGNHPSFCFMSMGNELQGDLPRMNELVTSLKSKDKRHLYTTTSFTFERGHGLYPEPVDDFFITQYTDSGWVRGQGVFDAEYPNFNTDYTGAMKHLPVPLITHEIGQYSVYPNLKEIDKYTGILEPLNFMAVKNDLESKDLLHLADEYLMASGQLAKILYKEEIERALKTDGICGFQLLDLHDFPGQGTALVGLLDAFWDSKGIISGDDFREFCSELVPLIKFKKAVYENTETFEAVAEIANYWQSLESPVFEWTITKGAEILANGELKPGNISQGTYAELGPFAFKLDGIKNPSKIDITLLLKNSKYQNRWSVWVYPELDTIDTGEVLVTTSWKEAETALSKGAKVLFTPPLNELNGIEGKFVPVFWSPVHFPDQPGTMGLLINDKHPVFDNFPTEFHSNWQWWDLCKQSKTLEMDGLQAARIITVVDNFFKNRNLANLIEAKVGDGLLVFSGMDLHSNLNERITAKALQKSIVDYMNSSLFAPSQEVSFKALTEKYKSN